MTIANVELSNTFNQFRTTTNEVIQQLNSASSSNGASTIVARDAAGSFAVNTVTASYFTGDGSNLTNLNASNVSSGTLPTARLATSGVSSGGYGNSTAVPQIVVDTYGRVTSASNVSINGINQFNYHSGNANFQITTPSGSSYTASIGQHLGTSANVTFQQLTVSGNLTVTGTTTTISANNLAVKDNLIYLNNESSNTNVDLGFAGNYNDGVYRHAGLFRDADDGVWKFFDRYTPEPDASANLNTSHASFNFGALKAGDVTSNGTFYGPLTGVAAVATVANTVTLTSDDSTNATRYLTFVDATSGNEDVRTDSGLTYNPSTGLITATQFSGSGATLTNIPNSATTASASNGASTIVARDASGSFTTNGITATSVSAPTLTGVASVATVANTSTLTADNTTNATNYVPFINSATGNQALRTSLGFSFNPSSNTLTAGSFVATTISAPTITGVAAVATVSNTSTLTADNTTNATNYLTFVNAATGNQALRTDTGLTFNPSTNTLTTSVVSAPTLTGVAAVATVGNTVTLTADDSTNATRYPLFSDAATGNVSPRTDTGFTYNPSTGVLTATAFSGSGASLTNIPNSATTASSSNGASTIVARDAAGAFAAGAVTINEFSSAQSISKVFTVQSGSYSVWVNPRFSAGAYNPLISANSAGLIFTNSASQSGNGIFLLAPWSDIAAGIRISQSNHTANTTIASNTLLLAATTTVDGALTATSVSAPTLTGVAAVATVSNTATLTADNTTNATNYLTFVNAATGNQALRTDIGLSFNPSTNTLTTTTFSGAFSGSGAALTSIPNSATTASSSNGASTIVARDASGSFTTNGITATSVNAPTLTGVAAVATVSNTSTLTADNTTNATNYLTFVNAATGNQALRTDTGLTFNPSTNTLTTTTFSGAFSGSGASLTSIPNSATTASASNGASTIVARDAGGNFTAATITATTFSGSGASLTNIPNSATTASASNGASTIVARDAGGNFTANNITAANLTTSGITTLNSQTVFNSFMKEKANVSASAATSIINFDAITAPVLYYTANSTGNFYLNVRGNSTNTLNSLTANNESISIAFLATQGATAYYHLTNIQIDGTNNSIRWQGGSAPTSGNINGIDGYAFTIIKTGNATYTVLGSQTQFKA